jgi:hypothetical protein
MVIWLEILRFHNFQKFTYSLSQIHKVEDENWFYRSSCSSTRFPLVEIQHISIFHAWLTIQIYFIYNHIILINMCLYYNLLEWIQFQGSKHDLKIFSTNSFGTKDLVSTNLWNSYGLELEWLVLQIIWILEVKPHGKFFLCRYLSLKSCVSLTFYPNALNFVV